MPQPHVHAHNMNSLCNGIKKPAQIRSPGIEWLCMVRLLTTLHIDSETTISWLPSSGQRCSLSRSAARAIRDSLRRTTATILRLQELLHQSDKTLERLRDPGNRGIEK